MKKIFLPILAIFITGFFFWQFAHKNPEPKNDNIKYKNNSLGISFEYPQKLIVKGDSKSITISHEVPFTHHDFCDFKGESTTTINTLKDFNVKIKISDENLYKTIRIESPYIPEENFLDGNIIPSPGFIDPVKFLKLNGYSIFEGAEGCGHTVYYLETKDKRTLIITSDLITVFYGSIDVENTDRALAVPGVIRPEESKIIFESIINSISVR